MPLRPDLRAIFCALLAVALAFPAAATCPTGSALFAPGVPISVGADPVGIVSGDFNHDGKPDVVVAISHLNSGVQGGQVRVMLGNGDGTFTAGQLATAGTTPLGITTGDFNHDGITDLAVTNYGSASVAILLGIGSGGFGDGTFGPPTLFACGPNPHQICTGDFNGDGILDLAVANNGSTTHGVSVLLGKGAGGIGNGQFDAKVDYPLNGLPVGILTRDVDQDGVLDLLVTEDTAGTLAFYRGKGDGTFFTASHIAAGITPYAIEMADLNGDGIPDIIVANSNSGGINVLRNGGPAGILSNANYNVGNVANVHVADMNGDGFPDIVYTTSISPVLGVLLGSVTGAFTAGPTVSTGGFSVYFTLTDMDLDGHADAAVSLYTSGVMAYFHGGCLTIPADPNLPRITSVRDVPNDQGGKVFVTWTRSALDATGGPVNAYRVWRRIPAAAAQARLMRTPGSLRVVREQRPDGTEAIVYWEAAAVLPAQRLAGYGYTSATPRDSLADSNPYTAFYITAATSNLDAFYDSPVDSGYSVDNLAPAPPRAFAAQYGTSSVTLHWPANSEADLAGYEVYRGTSPSFVPGPGNRILAANDTTFTDLAGGLSTYKLTAVDLHGNRSPFAVVSPSVPTAAEVSLVQGSYDAGAARLDWYVDATLVPQADVQREDSGGWVTLAHVTPDGAGHVRWTDAALAAGQSANYRLAWSSPLGGRTGGEVRVTAPALLFALHGAEPNPSRGREGALTFTLPRGGDAALAIYDTAGRRVAQRVITGAAGTQHVTFASLQLHAGVYLATLSQGGQRASRRFVILP